MSAKRILTYARRVTCAAYSAQFRTLYAITRLFVSPVEMKDVLGAGYGGASRGVLKAADHTRVISSACRRGPSQRAAARFGAIALLALAMCGCGRGQEVTSESLASARKLWQQANIRNYNLEWTSSGSSRGHYWVFVRNGQVKEVRSVLRDGKEVEIHPAQPKFYGVDGLLQVIDDELAQLKADRPFNQPKGTKVVLWFSTDPKLGYPRKYRRDVFGTPQGESIDVIRLEPTTADAEVPRPG